VVELIPRWGLGPGSQLPTLPHLCPIGDNLPGSWQVHGRTRRRILTDMKTGDWIRLAGDEQQNQRH
jgi:hypothetical protein